MASAAIFSSLRRRRSPSLEAFLAPVDLSGVALVETLASLSSELVSSFRGKTFFFQRTNSRSLIRKMEIFALLLDYLNESGSDRGLSMTSVLCFKELYMLFHRAQILLDYCEQSSKLWLLLQNPSVSGHFHDLNREISILLDVLPVRELRLSEDIREQIELLQKQARRSELRIDKNEDALRKRAFEILEHFERGRVPRELELRLFFVDKLAVRDSNTCRAEIEFLEEQIANHGGELEPDTSAVNGFVAIMRYCRFLLFGFNDDDFRLKCDHQDKLRKGLITREIGETFVRIPKDFCCPISLDLMRDPVIISTGQTYDRSSISRWMEEGHCTCPKTGQILISTRMMPNRALRNLILQWCAANAIAYDSENTDPCCESYAVALPMAAAIEANRATTSLLIHNLGNASQAVQAVAAREIRLLAKTGKDNRALIAEAGAIPHLCKLLRSPNAVAQENSVTAMLNLSIYEKNKTRIMEEEGCLESVVEVLRAGLTTEARENAAATLFSLSAVHDYKRRIADEDGVVHALAGLLRNGTPRGKKDAVTALFNLSTHPLNCVKMIEAGALSALVGALENEDVAEEAAGTLGLIVRQPIGAQAVGKEGSSVSNLLGVMRYGTPRGKENAVAALLELCRSGGVVVAERVLRAPALAGLLQTLLFTGTKRARRKAASLARVFQRCESSYNASTLHSRGYAMGGDSNRNRDSSFSNEVSVAMTISVPVL